MPIEVDFDTIADYPVGQPVIFVGRLAMFGSTYCNGECGLLLENPNNLSQKITIFVTVGTGPNQMKPLSDNYTKSDIQIMLDDGTYATIGWRIRVTGKVGRTTSDAPCITDITKIEFFKIP